MKHFILVATCLSLLSAQQAAANPSTTVFAFDLHHVVVKPNLWERAKILLKSPDRWTLLQHALNPIFLFDLYRVFGQQSRAYERGMAELHHKYPKLKKVDGTIAEMANAQCPIPETMQLIEQLKTQGYKVYLLSNIGEHWFDKFKEKFGNIVALFDGCAICERLNGYMQKPSLAMYKNFRNKFGLWDKKIIFLDDLKSNIKSANAMGFHGIHFKSMNDVLTELTSINIMIP